jgi:hypothetical protein
MNGVLLPPPGVIPANAGTQRRDFSGKGGDLGPRIRGDDMFVLCVFPLTKRADRYV